MNERRNELSKSRWVPPTTTKESIRRGSLRGRWNPPSNQASNQTVTFVPSNMNDTSNEKKRKAYSTWVSMDTETNQASNQTVTFVPSNMNDTSTEKKRKAYSTWVSMDTETNQASNQTVTFVPSNMNDTSTEKERKAYSTWVSMDTESHWNRTNSDQSSVGTLNIRSNFGSPYMKGCETIKELIHLASSHGDLLSTKHLSAFWSRVPQLLNNISSNNSPQQKHEQQLKNDLHRILHITTKKLNRFSHTEIVGTILGMAKVIKHYCTNCKNNHSGSRKSYLSIFQDLIFDQNFNAQADLFQSMADISASILSSQHMEARLLSNLAYAFALIKRSPHELFDRLSKNIIENASSFEPQGISNVLWAYATLELASCPRVFEAFANHIVELDDLDEFIPQHLASILWSYAKIGEHNHTDLFNKIASAIDTRDLGAFELQDLSITAWAFATIANVASPDRDCAFIAAIQNKELEFNDAQLRALHQWQLWQLELGSLTSLPSSLRLRCYDAFIMDRSRPSRLQNDVVNELTSMGFHPQEEMILSCSGYRLDACVLVHGEKVGIEVDGPLHFTGFKPTGHTILKRRQVKNIDRMKIVSVPYWEWDALDSWRRRQEYLSRKLSIGLSTEKMMISPGKLLLLRPMVSYDDDM